MRSMPVYLDQRMKVDASPAASRAYEEVERGQVHTNAAIFFRTCQQTPA
jgi:hypothetical protein